MIIVHGATGFTGGLVCDALAGTGQTFAIAGRRADALERLATSLEGDETPRPQVHVVADLAAADLDRAFGEASVVINCVGPFVDYGRPVVEAAIRNETHYLDTTGEQPFIAQCADEHDAAARERGVLLLPASAFEYAIGDCAAALLAEHGVQAMTVFYATTGAATSRGTKKSILRMLERDGVALVRGERVQRRPAARTYEVEIAGRRLSALWFGGGEPISVPRHHSDVHSVSSAIVVSPAVARVLNPVSGAIPAVTRALRPMLDRIIDHTAPDPHVGADEPARFVVKAVDDLHRGSWVALRGEAPYSVTARIITEAARRLDVDGSDLAGYGSIPGCFEPGEFMAAVGVDVEDVVGSDATRGAQ